MQGIDLVGTVPLSERLSALARVGMQYARTRSDFSGSSAAVVADPGASRKDTNVKLDATKIAAVGKGEAMPVTKPGNCSGNQGGPKLIACLQPDRRVEVEVAGTR